MKKIGFAITTLFLVVALAFSSCVKKTWTQDVKDNFLKSCLTEGYEMLGLDLDEYCNCVLEKLMEKYPNPKDVEDLSYSETMEISKDCFELF